MVQFNNSWDILLKDEFQKPYYLNLRKFLVQEYKTQTIYPHMNDIFNALKYTDYKDVKVVILGQDPYHQPNQAHGLCFSVKKGVNPPPSLQNMYKEIYAEYGYPIPQHGELTYWAEQGVLMMNTVLTVRESQPNSHKGMGWEIFTDNVISLLNLRPEPMVFLLWGANARAKKKIITNPNHLVLESAHPSPLSAYNGFFGNGHFKKANEFLKQHKMTEIDWKIE
ncbi:MAG: uracil-DNA glycosylase [Clostridia bacterium]|nr:uracil-DNA glycosylase [Clostridia bacterium]